MDNAPCMHRVQPAGWAAPQLTGQQHLTLHKRDLGLQRTLRQGAASMPLAPVPLPDSPVQDPIRWRQRRRSTWPPTLAKFCSRHHAAVPPDAKIWIAGLQGPSGKAAAEAQKHLTMYGLDLGLDHKTQALGPLC